MAKIAMVIAHKDFRDEEYFIPKDILMSKGIEVATISTSLDKAVGMFGGEANIDALINNLNVKDFDAVLFIGGQGAGKNIDNSDFHQAAKATIEAGKVLGAICIAPTILAKAGVLEGKKATVWSNQMDKSAIKILKENGAVYQEQPVVVDGKIITANGPAVAKDFANEIIGLLEKG